LFTFYIDLSVQNIAILQQQWLIHHLRITLERKTGAAWSIRCHVSGTLFWGWRTWQLG